MLTRGYRRHTIQEVTINTVRRTAAAVAAGVVLALGSVASATPAQADVKSTLCDITAAALPDIVPATCTPSAGG